MIHVEEFFYALATFTYRERERERERERKKERQRMVERDPELLDNKALMDKQKNRKK